jgi:hypothetical protein
MQNIKGQTVLYLTNSQGHSILQQPYSGRLVVTAHATHEDADPYWADDITRRLESFMREHGLSRIEAYWNAVPPPEDTTDE